MDTLKTLQALRRQAQDEGASLLESALNAAIEIHIECFISAARSLERTERLLAFEIQATTQTIL